MDPLIHRQLLFPLKKYRCGKLVSPTSACGKNKQWKVSGNVTVPRISSSWLKPCVLFGSTLDDSLVLSNLWMGVRMYRLVLFRNERLVDLRRCLNYMIRRGPERKIRGGGNIFQRKAIGNRTSNKCKQTRTKKIIEPPIIFKLNMFCDQTKMIIWLL